MVEDQHPHSTYMVGRTCCPFRHIPWLNSFSFQVSRAGGWWQLNNSNRHTGNAFHYQTPIEGNLENASTFKCFRPLVCSMKYIRWQDHVPPAPGDKETGLASFCSAPANDWKYYKGQNNIVATLTWQNRGQNTSFQFSVKYLVQNNTFSRNLKKERKIGWGSKLKHTYYPSYRKCPPRCFKSSKVDTYLVIINLGDKLMVVSQEYSVGTECRLHPWLRCPFFTPFTTIFIPRWWRLS